MDSLQGLDEGARRGVVYFADGEAAGGPSGLGGAGEDDVGVRIGGAGGGGEVAEDGEAEAGHCACEGDDGHLARLVFKVCLFRFMV